MKKSNKNSVATVLEILLVLGLIVPLAVLAAGPETVNLGSAGNFVILTKSGISTTGTTSITGDIGVSPIVASAITGFDLILTAAGTFSTSARVTGKVYAADYAPPTPAVMTTAISDMQTAYTDAAGRASTVTELGAGNIGGLTLVPGVYKWGTGVVVPVDVTLSGGANDVWIFQIAQTLTVSSGVHINLAGGAQASNIFWQVAGQTTIGTTAVFNGNILDQTAIVLNTGAVLNGRALAQTAVTLDSNAVTMPTSVASTPAPSPTPVTTSEPTPTSSTASSQTSSASSVGSTSSSQSTATPTQSLNSKQQQQYDTLVSAGASQSTALNAVNQMSINTPSVPASYSSSFGQQIKTIAVNLGQGNKSEDVRILQQFLISENKGTSASTLATVGATSYFGVLTRAALAEFQGSVGISPALGNFGPITRGYISTH